MPTPMPQRTAPRRAAILMAAALLAVAPAAVAFAEDSASAFVLADPRIVESSGLQTSGLHPGVYWTHNDSEGAAAVYAVDSATGETVATVTLAGITARDLEAISLGPDGDLYIGDIGDNFGGAWPEVWIYRIPEPETLADATVTPTVYTVQYEDGPRDAESLMVHPETGRVYLVSKMREGGGALYAGPEELSESSVNTFQRGADIDVWATDGAFSPDGTRLLVRSYFSARMYAWSNGTPDPIQRQVIPPAQQQGESVTFTPDGRTLMFGSEGEASEVEPEPLRGDLLPESAAPEEEPEPSESAPPADDNAAESEDDDGGLLSQAVTVAFVAILLTLGLRRLFARGGARKPQD